MVKNEIINVLRNTKFRISVALGGSAAVAALVFGVGAGQAAVGGPTCTVGSGADYPTISAAVADSGCTTIKVKPGTYAENVVVNRAVDIRGAKAWDDVSGRTASGPAESTVTGTSADTPTFTVTAPNVTINGFSITNSNHGTGVDIKTAGDNTVLRYSIVDSIGGAAYSANATGVYLELGPDNVRVAHNRISNVQSTPTAQGVLVGDSTSTNPALNERFVDNTIDGITSTRGAYGIQVNNGTSKGGSKANTSYSTVKILGNKINDLTATGTGWVHAIGLEGQTPNSVVSRNVVSNLTAPGADKIAVWFEDNLFYFTVDVNRNNLAVGNTEFGIAVHPSLTTAYPSLNLDGTCNWWGAANGPSSVGSGSGSHVSTGVDFSPWLKSANLNGNCGNHHDNHDGDNGDFDRHHEDEN